MAAVEGLSSVLKALGGRLDEAKRDGSPSVRVGYTQEYALFVHEDRTARHATGKAGFLLDPARDLSATLGVTVGDGLKKGLSLSQALLRAGLRLQRESQQQVPVEFGTLRASAFTRLEQS